MIEENKEEEDEAEHENIGDGISSLSRKQEAEDLEEVPFTKSSVVKPVPLVPPLTAFNSSIDGVERSLERVKVKLNNRKYREKAVNL